jgi:uncharacterized protein YydD (DUF2326 family)
MTNDAMREKLVTVSNLLADLTGAVAEIAAEFGEVKKVETAKEEVKQEEAPAKAEEKKYTLEDVRKALAEKSGAGFTDQVRELLQKHGGNKLSAINEAEYASIMEEVQTIGSAQ